MYIYGESDSQFVVLASVLCFIILKKCVDQIKIYQFLIIYYLLKLSKVGSGSNKENNKQCLQPYSNRTTCNPKRAYILDK